jgi:hypothetical protein
LEFEFKDIVMNRYKKHFGIAISSTLILLSGCNIHAKHDEAGHESDVSISSPLGGLKVRTDKVDPKDTGMSVYPGARMKEKTDDHNDNKANVNIDTPWFGVKVVALTYLTDDPQEKVWDYYKKELSKYGHVLECKPGSADLHASSKQKNELTCNDKEDDKKGMDIHPEDVQLKVGTDDRQRIVGFKRSGKGTEFSLVYVVAREGKDSL